MGDMTAILAPKSDQINADDLIGRTITITVAGVTIKGGQEQPISIHFDGSDKVFRPCKSMCRVLAHAWGLDSKEYVGKSMTLYCDPSVKFGPLAVGGIRISHMSHIDGEMQMALTATKGVKKAYKVKPLVAERQSQAPAGLSAEQALSDMEAAGDLDELRVIWMRKAMAPHRPALQPDLDRIKARLAPPGEDPDDSQRGESHNLDPDWLIGKINQCTGSVQIIELVRSWSDAIYELAEEDRARIAEAQDAKTLALKGQPS